MTGVTYSTDRKSLTRFRTRGICAAERAKNRSNEYEHYARERRLTPAERISRIEQLRRRPALRVREKQTFGEQVNGIISTVFSDVRRMTRDSARFPTVSVMLTLAFACILMLVVYSSVQLSEATRDLNTLRADVSQQNAEISMLESSVAAKQDLEAIENYALNELGMIKKDAAASEYISVGLGDNVELYGADGEANRKNASLLSAFSERVRALLEYFN